MYTNKSDDDPRSVSGDIFLDLKNHSIEEIMNGDSFNDVRLDMLNGKEPEMCKRCYREEEAGIWSKRAKENKTFSHFTIEEARDRTRKDGSLKDIDLEFIELRLGNICNVKCRTCNPWSSSKWITDYNKLRGKFTTLDLFDKEHNQFDWPEQDKFWDDLFENSKSAKVFYINGGEPTLIKEHFRFLQRMIDAGRTNVKLWYNINMTNMTPEIIDIWKQFDDVEVGFSIDDIGNRNEYIRHPTKWDKVNETVDMLLEHKDTMQFAVTQTVSWMNFYYLDEMKEWANSKGIWVHHNFVTQPSWFSPDALPLEIRKEIIEKVTPAFPKDEDPGKILGIKQFGEKPTDLALLKKAMDYTHSLDKMRGESFEETFPELYDRLKGYM
jgi:MoaA/NifB/PqqE/SkfB family radical SAM enzyme